MTIIIVTIIIIMLLLFLSTFVDNSFGWFVCMYTCLIVLLVYIYVCIYLFLCVCVCVCVYLDFYETHLRNFSIIDSLVMNPRSYLQQAMV